MDRLDDVPDWLKVYDRSNDGAPDWLELYNQLSKDQKRSLYAHVALAYAAALYKEKHNPIYVWDAYLNARQIGGPIPDWILAYFDRVGSNIAVLSRRLRSHKPIPTAVAEALEFTRPGKQGPINLLNETGTRRHEVEIAAEFYMLYLKDPKAKLMALKKLAAERHLESCTEEPRCTELSPNTVENHWKAHMGLFLRHLPPDSHARLRFSKK